MIGNTESSRSKFTQDHINRTWSRLFEIPSDYTSTTCTALAYGSIPPRMIVFRAFGILHRFAKPVYLIAIVFTVCTYTTYNRNAEDAAFLLLLYAGHNIPQNSSANRRNARAWRPKQ